MIIGHASDLHGAYKKLEVPSLPDVWVITGDFFPNYGRGPRTNKTIDKSMEHGHQLRWWRYKGPSVMRRLGGKPVLWMPGNHDFISLAGMLKVANYPFAHDVSKEPIDLMGQRFAGYRDIPYLEGEWMGETHRADFEPIVRQAMEADPTILLTHAPPEGVLDDDCEGPTGHGPGIPGQIRMLAYMPHRVTHHLFGHIHKQGGKIVEEMGIKFVNSSCCVQMLDVP